jgi:HD-GYP domain-containing protein (c-di-GMP phosphodiesterase class II)
MEQASKKVVRESVAASLLTICAAYAFFLSLMDISVPVIPPQEYFLATLITGSILLADRYPIHLLRGTKLSLINLPIFLATALLSAPVAIAVTGLGLLVANSLAREKRGLLARDIAATASQWMLTVFLGHQILQLGTDGDLSRLVLLFLCAFSFLFIDFSFFSISQASIYEEPFLATLKAVVKQGFSLEVIQYLIAIPGILAADVEPWSLILLVVPVVIAHIAFKDLKETRFETVQVLNDMADTVDLRDTCTGGHSEQVADLVHRLLVQLNLSGPEATLIEIAARLHDIGKIGIPDRILLKPGPLIPAERAIMQTHAEKGAELITKYKDFSRGAAIIRHHHERWDGQGYPAHLKEHEIPFGARVIAVADSFEAMTSDRPYRKALSVDEAIQILLEGRGSQWDPNIVNAFVDMIMSQTEERSTEGLSKQQAESALPQPVLAPTQRSLSASGQN